MLDQALQMLRFIVLIEIQGVSAAPIPALAGSGTAALGLHSIHSYGYASRSSPAFTGTSPAPSLGILVRNPG